MDKGKHGQLSHTFLGLVTITPLIIGYLLVMDSIYIINSIVIIPMSMLIRFFFCGFIKVDRNCIDFVYVKMFGMNSMDILGFHRLRTITQLVFESVP